MVFSSYFCFAFSVCNGCICAKNIPQIRYIRFNIFHMLKWIHWMSQCHITWCRVCGWYIFLFLSHLHTKLPVIVDCCCFRYINVYKYTFATIRDKDFRHLIFGTKHKIYILYLGTGFDFCDSFCFLLSSFVFVYVGVPYNYFWEMNDENFVYHGIENVVATVVSLHFQAIAQTVLT